MSGPAPTSVDIETIRTAYAAGLNIFTGRPVSRVGVLELRDELRRYVDVLMPETLAIIPRTRGTMRSASLHALKGGYQVLKQIDGQEPASEEEAPLGERTPMRDRDAVFELAILCRSFLTLVTQPGPLGDPVGVEEIQVALQRHVCGRCWQIIVEGDMVNVAVCPGDAIAVHSFVHVECTPRRPALVRVPVQPGPV